MLRSAFGVRVAPGTSDDLQILKRCGEAKSRFFAYHPRTYPKELMLFGTPETFGVPVCAE
jgi:hypothetical protein